jgi:hypothetical protein
MESTIVTTTQEIIHAFLELPQQEQEAVRNFVNSTNGDVGFLVKAFDEEYIDQESYSQEDRDALDQMQKETRQRKNTSGPFRNGEIHNHLKTLMNKS